MEGIRGHDRAIEILQSALRTHRLHHAYIFHGPIGVGKFTTGLAFARILLCPRTATNGQSRVAACGDCDSCRLLHDPDAPTHPDLHIVRKELARYSEHSTIRERKLTSIPVEILRNTLIEPVYRAAQMGHHKVFIVDEAELLNPAGQNLLLKTLEEPPPGTYLILVTANEDRLLPTVRSRCQRVAFTSLPRDVISQRIDATSADLDQWQRAWLIGFASGSLGRAELAVAYDLFEWAQQVLTKIDAMTEQRYPTDLGTQMAAFIDDFAKCWVQRHENASKDAANRQGVALMWSLIAGHAQEQVKRIAADCRDVDPIEAEASLEPWLHVIDALQTTEEEIASNVNLALVCDHLVSLMYRGFVEETTKRRSDEATKGVTFGPA